MLDFTSSMLADESVLMEDFLKFMKMADPSIANVMIEDEAANSAMLSKIIQEGMAPRKRPVFEHFSKTGTFKVALNQESKGLQRLYNFTATLLFALHTPSVIVIDELEVSIHPHIARYIIELFQNPEVNLGRSQLVFTTHDTNLLDQELLRRDQIWFVEKDDCCSHLYSLLDFSPRNDENLELGYLRGRYGAIPVLSGPQWFSAGEKVNSERGRDVDD